MENLDAQTLALLVAFIQFVFFLVFGVSALRSKEKYLKYITTGLFINTLGFAFVSLNSVSIIIGSYIANILLIYGYVVVIFGFCELMNFKKREEFFFYTLIVHLIIYFYFTFVAYNLIVRMFIFSFEAVAIGLYFLVISLKYYSKKGYLIILLFALSTIVFKSIHIWRMAKILIEISQPGIYFLDYDITKYLFLSMVIFNVTLFTSIVLLASKIYCDKLNEKNAELFELASIDYLTKIDNLRTLLKKLEREIRKSKTNDEKLSLLMIDIDNFKKINDKFGHMIGDKVLLVFSQIIKANLRLSDIFGRYGGEEFLLILPNTGIEESKHLINRIYKSLNEIDWELDDQDITFSGGMIEINNNNYDLETRHLINKADELLYLAKKKGKNRIEC